MRNIPALACFCEAHRTDARAGGNPITSLRRLGVAKDRGLGEGLPRLLADAERAEDEV